VLPREPPVCSSPPEAVGKKKEIGDSCLYPLERAAATISQTELEKGKRESVVVMALFCEPESHGFETR
jgi:hypothetical protein